MENLRLIQIEWNKYNGFVFGFIGCNEKHLISINSAWNEFFYNRAVFYSVQNL